MREGKAHGEDGIIPEVIKVMTLYFNLATSF